MGMLMRARSGTSRRRNTQRGGEQQGTCEHEEAGVAQGEIEANTQSQLLPGERNVAAVAVDLPAERIQTQTCELSHRWPVVGAPAVERSETEHELPELERLRKVVVGADFEAGGLVVEPVGSGEHEDRHAAGGSDDTFGHLVTG